MKAIPLVSVLWMSTILTLSGCTGAATPTSAPPANTPTVAQAAAATKEASPTVVAVSPTAVAKAPSAAVAATPPPATVSPTMVQPTSALERSVETPGAWNPDGTIGDGEYAHDATLGQVHLWWSNDDEYLYLAFEATTDGWVAVGLDPDARMAGANYLLGAVVGGAAEIRDAYGTAPVGAHPLDTDLGGSHDIVAFAAVEEGGITRFEVQIPLDSGDEFDKALSPGATYPVIVALGGSDDFGARHVFRTAGEITLD